jgi:malate dehydrogenase (oxaloacetate-decarboxylating)
MEGKALLFKHLGGVDAVPICLGTKDPDEIIQAVKWLQPSFAGINLEDIANPKCFYILDKLREQAEIPVWHDDQQGTATVVLAGLYSALDIIGKKISEVTVAQLGIGGAGTAVMRLLIKAGVPAENIRVVDLVDGESAILTNDLDLEGLFKYRGEMLSKTNAGNLKGGVSEALTGADVMISFMKSGPGVIKPEQIKLMAKDAICFACANPIPEIWPWEAKEAGARIVGTGRSDFPNQVNNSIGFPAIFRGVLDVRAKTITDEMCLVAAKTLAQYAKERGTEKDICPRMDEPESFIRVAVEVGMEAQKEGIAGVTISRENLRKKVEKSINEARELHDALVKTGCIAPAVTD